MTDKSTLSRRTLLYGSATAAGAVMLGACAGEKVSPGDEGSGGSGEDTALSGKGSHKTALKTPAELSESPILQEQVKAGKLPKLEDRLPENPYVVPHKWLKKGKYGGTMRMLTMATSGPDADSNRELFYGHSLLRWLNDGLDIGPGVCETWDHNADASEWTFKFRKGLKWSDGQDWSTADIMFWWNHMILDEAYPDVPPDECKSGKGTVAKLEAVDELTLKVTFDAPAPLTADRVAMWVSGPVGSGKLPQWMVPAHYAEKFHPKYNPKISKNWATAGGLFDKKVNIVANPDCPTLNGWQVKSIKEGRNITWERNPYYYAVSPDGDQLPYVDTIDMDVFKESRVGKLEVYQGKVDYLMGQFYDTGTADIADIQDNAKKAKIEYYLWDSGSGTGSMFFFNHDHKDEAFRKLIRTPKFKQAISHAFNRKEVKKSVYFNTGEETTGTLSPKAIEYVINDEGKQVYKHWRDSYVEYDPAKAKQLLDEVGCKDKDGDGFREMPGGEKLVITFDFPPDMGEEHLAKNNLLKRDLEQVGLKVRFNPQPGDTIKAIWKKGSLTSYTDWEVGDGPNHLVYPQWLVPIGPERWAPLQGQWYNVRGTPEANKELGKEPFERTPPRMEPDKGGPIEALWKLYDQSRVEPDEMKRHQLVWKMIRIHIDQGPFFMGSVANTPRVVVKKSDLSNIPDKKNLAQNGFCNPWIHPVPAVYDPETYFWENPSEHGSA